MYRPATSIQAPVYYLACRRLIIEYADIAVDGSAQANDRIFFMSLGSRTAVCTVRSPHLCSTTATMPDIGKTLAQVLHQWTVHLRKLSLVCICGAVISLHRREAAFVFPVRHCDSWKQTARLPRMPSSEGRSMRSPVVQVSTVLPALPALNQSPQKQEAAEEEGTENCSPTRPYTQRSVDTPVPPERWHNGAIT
jgi:hypothetical protein